jgi:hypothetical protein
MYQGGNMVIKMKCPKCGSSQIQSLKKTKTSWCRHCLWEGKHSEAIVKDKK